ncbi:FecR family protein [Mucilaginibacter ximonensis]|uniref:FecR family protein n=1 Tax=Mucilaginibacter ximonensis TaxID=538021 RepID=A0ABW5YG02_9SPHI
MDNQRAKELLIKYNEGQCTEEEKALVESWYLSTVQNDEKITHDEIESAMHHVRKALPGLKVKRLSLWPRIAAAAILLVAIGVTLLYLKKLPEAQSDVKNDMLPGSNKATLTLANGKKISLTDAADGTVAKERNVTINKNANGNLSYVSGDQQVAPGEIEYNTIETPKGGQYKIKLPDGTDIWLNAETKLKYPTTFASLKNRPIELEGEAYFEVAKDKGHPFIVTTSKEKVEVLGTHFNINAYDNDKVVKTTLLEGSVKVSNQAGSTKIMKPGQQATADGESLAIRDVETDYEVAWKDGYFIFNNENLESIMAKISRWYNADVVFMDPTLKSKSFIGTISRFDKVSKVLNMLERTDVAVFNIESGKIIVSRKTRH